MKFIKTIELTYAHLKACDLFKAHRDVRFYLCGVQVGNGFMSATNGHCLLRCVEPEATGLEVIIPAEAIKSFLTKVGNKPNITTFFLHQIDKEFWLLEHPNGSYELFKPIDGKYPDVGRVDLKKPTETSLKYFPSFDFDYLAKFKKAAAIVNNSVVANPTLYPTSESGSCYVEISDEVHGVIMPMRT